MPEIHYGRGYVYSIQYHLVWCVKYRHDILYGHVDIDVKQLLKQIADDNNVKIMEMESDKDHIHLLIECFNNTIFPVLLKHSKVYPLDSYLKNIPNLNQRLWGGHLWNPSYFVATVSENTEEQIRKYIQNQKKR